ncbi:MAG: amidohydrolase family protein, partial [Planctomycetota bacterium]
DVKIIAAHINANWPVTKGIMKSTNSNFNIDISGCYPEAGVIEQIVDEIGADRVIYGSDFTGRSLPSQIAKVELANLSDEDKEKILWKNTADLFHIKEEKLCSDAALPDKPDIDLSKDYSVFCGEWAINPERSITPEILDKLLQKNNITEAWTASLSAILCFDLQFDNNKFLNSVSGIKSIKPLATLNPAAYNWQDVIAEAESFSGFMLHPYLHNWCLSDDNLSKCFESLVSTNKPIFINLEFGDDRFKHYSLNPKVVTKEEMDIFAERYNTFECIFQGGKPNVIEGFLKKYNSPNFKFEISRLTDTSWSLRDTIAKYGTKNFVMGAEYPLREMGETRFCLNYL